MYLLLCLTSMVAGFIRDVSSLALTVKEAGVQNYGNERGKDHRGCMSARLSA